MTILTNEETQQMADKVALMRGTMSKEEFASKWLDTKKASPTGEAKIESYDLGYTKEPYESLTVRSGEEFRQQGGKEDVINHPKHYEGPVQAIEAIEAWTTDWPHEISPHLANVTKYVARCGRKGKLKQDLEKAKWYLERAIERLD